jgi:hypothetical protein
MPKVLCWYTNIKGETDTKVIESSSSYTLEKDLRDVLRLQNSLAYDPISPDRFDELLLSRVSLTQYLPETGKEVY